MSDETSKANKRLFTKQKSIFVRAYEDFREGAFWYSLRFFLNAKHRVGMVTFYGKPEGDIKVGIGSHSMTPIINSGDKTPITIGKFTSIGRNLSIITSGGHNPKLTSTYSFSTEMIHTRDPKYTFGGEKVEIGNDVWIGNDVTIMGGAKIGDGVVIGTKSLVPRGKVLDDYGVYGGVPVKLIRYRFDKASIKKLKELKWWDLDPEAIKDNWKTFYEDPKIAYKKLLKLKMHARAKKGKAK